MPDQFGERKWRHYYSFVEGIEMMFEKDIRRAYLDGVEFS